MVESVVRSADIFPENDASETRRGADLVYKGAFEAIFSSDA